MKRALTLATAVLVLGACTGHPSEDAIPRQSAEPIILRVEPWVPEQREPPQPPEPIAEVEAAPVEPPPAPRARLRKNLRMAQYEPDAGWVIDIIDLYQDEATIAEVQRLIELAEQEESELPGATLTPGGVGLPRAWKIGDTWTLVTVKGVTRRKVSRYSVSQGPGEIHTRVELSRDQARLADVALAVRGTRASADLVFDKPASRDGTALGEGGLERLRAAIDDGISDDVARKLFARARITEGSVAIYDARLPHPWTSVVFVDAPSRAWGEPARASALLLLAKDGTLRHELLPHIEAGQLRARAILDVDGNGIDEVFYADSYSEGEYEMMLWFDRDRPRRRILTGDGA